MTEQMQASILSVDIAGQLGAFDYSYAFESRTPVTTIFGISGAGKSTLIKAISGEVRPARGAISVAGDVFVDTLNGIQLDVPLRRVGHIFQDGRLFPHMNVRRNLTFAKWAGFRKGALKFDDVIDLLGIGALLARYPATLSGGEKRRVAIGRALLSDPRILLADEPLSGLDFARRADVLPYLKTLSRDTGIPLIYVSHDIREIIELGGTLALVEAGRIAQVGPLPQVLPAITEMEDGWRAAPRSLLSGVFLHQDGPYPSSVLHVGNQTMRVSQNLAARAEPYTLVVSADDVALSLAALAGTSFQNMLKVRVVSFSDAYAGRVDVTLDLDGQALIARITERARMELGLEVGMSVYALIKSVALEQGIVAG